MHKKTDMGYVPPSRESDDDSERKPPYLDRLSSWDQKLPHKEGDDNPFL